MNNFIVTLNNNNKLSLYDKDEPEIELYSVTVTELPEYGTFDWRYIKFINDDAFTITFLKSGLTLNYLFSILYNTKFKFLFLGKLDVSREVNWLGKDGLGCTFNGSIIKYLTVNNIFKDKYTDTMFLTQNLISVSFGIKYTRIIRLDGSIYKNLEVSYIGKISNSYIYHDVIPGILKIYKIADSDIIFHQELKYDFPGARTLDIQLDVYDSLVLDTETHGALRLEIDKDKHFSLVSHVPESMYIPNGCKMYILNRKDGKRNLDFQSRVYNTLVENGIYKELHIIIMDYLKNYLRYEYL